MKDLFLLDRLRRHLLRTEAAATRDAAFGLLACAKGYVRSDELAACARERTLRRTAGTRARLGDLLLERGHLTLPQYLEILSLEEDFQVPGPD